MTIEEKEDEMTKRIKNKLDSTKYRIADIMSYVVEDDLLRDGTTKTVIVTNFTEMTFGNSVMVITDPETMEMLYVQTGVMNFVDIDVFFKKKQSFF